jgi:hypothetical protein
MKFIGDDYSDDDDDVVAVQRRTKKTMISSSSLSRLLLASCLVIVSLQHNGYTVEAFSAVTSSTSHHRMAPPQPRPPPQQQQQQRIGRSKKMSLKLSRTTKLSATSSLFQDFVTTVRDVEDTTTTAATTQTKTLYVIERISELPTNDKLFQTIANMCIDIFFKEQLLLKDGIEVGTSDEIRKKKRSGRLL